MNHAYVGKWCVRSECQQASITASVCGMALLVAALVMGARDLFVMCGITATLAGGFFGAALMARRLERRFKES